MKRILTFVFALAMALSLAACGNSGDSNSNNGGNNNSGASISGNNGSSEKTDSSGESERPAVTMTAGELLNGLKESLGDSYTSDTAETEDRMSGYYGLDLEQVESWAAECNSMSSMNMDTAVVLKVKEGYAGTAAALLQECLDQTASYAQMYNMDLFRVNEARLFVSDNYIGYFIQGIPADWQAPEEDQARQAADEAKKLDDAWEAVFGAAENIAVIPAPSDNGGSDGGLILPEDDGGWEG